MATIFDSSIFSQYLSDEETVRLLSDEQRVTMLLRVEMALADAQAKAGMIPAEAAQIIAECLANFQPDPIVLAESTRQNGIPIIGLLALARKQLPDSNGWLPALRSYLTGHHRHSLGAHYTSGYCHSGGLYPGHYPGIS